MLFPSISIIKSLNIKPNKALGQNFLIDPNIASKIIAACNVSSADTVIEIGAGLGALTALLAEKAQQVIAIEIDKNLAAVLQRFCAADTVITIVNDTILSVDLRGFIQPPKKAVFAGNFPYAITTPLFLKVAETSSLIKRGVFMVQKEVWQRLSAAPGCRNYGILSVYIQRYFKITHLLDVPAKCFFPKPRVDSTVLLLQPLPERDWDSPGEDSYRQIVAAALAHRRKTLANCLKTYFAGGNIDDASLKTRLYAAGIDCSRRGETLTLLEFEKLAAVITALQSNTLHITQSV
jgi:16S rRNA (adenine1518-N6/adenine1519-N6)-dimethyltransferase